MADQAVKGERDRISGITPQREASQSESHDGVDIKYKYKLSVVFSSALIQDPNFLFLF